MWLNPGNICSLKHCTTHAAVDVGDVVWAGTEEKGNQVSGCDVAVYIALAGAGWQLELQTNLHEV